MKLEIEVFHWTAGGYCYCATNYIGGRTRFSGTIQGAEEQVVRDTQVLFRRMINSRKNPFRSFRKKPVIAGLLNADARKIEIEV